MPTLNVMLHGLMAICEKGDKLLVFLPDVTDVHVFRAGSWLAETEVLGSEKPYVLKGVTPGKGQFDRTMNVHLGELDLPATAGSSSHAVLELDRPREIRALRTVEITPGDDFEGNDLSRVSGSKRIATAQLLIYDCPDLKQVKIEGHAWNALEQEGTGTANLHIFAEEELPSEGTVEHALKAFNDMVTDVTGLDLRLKRAQQVPGFDSTLDIIPDTLDEMETEDFAKRQSRVRDFGQNLRTVLHRKRQPDQSFEPLDTQVLLTPFDPSHSVGSKLGSCTLIVFSGR